MGDRLFMRPLAVAMFLALVSCGSCNVYDVVLPKYLAAQGCECLPWSEIGSASNNASEQARIDSYWASGKSPVNASNYCAMPAASAGLFECDGCTVDKIYNSFKGPWCYCKNSTGGSGETYCQPPEGIPEQINLQFAAPGVVVASFVTFDRTFDPSSPSKPEAMMAPEGQEMQSVLGVSHRYDKLSKVYAGNYTFHFIKFAGLKAGQRYQYKVRSGLSGGAWSATFVFRGPVSSEKAASTRWAAYGDMGHSHYNCMGNIRQDCAAGKIDAVLHMGDHAYDMGNGGDRRGDAYMNAFQPAIAGCPWIPVIGNHETNDGDNTERFLNMTFGEAGYQSLSSLRSTATTALGDFLTKTTLLGAGAHSGVPSNTSQYFAVNLGLAHIIGIDLNSAALIAPGSAQYEWLVRDLEAVDRNVTPWVFVTSHFPLYHATAALNLNASAAYYTGEAAEAYSASGHEFQPRRCDAMSGGCEASVGELFGSLQSSLDPLLAKYKVDVYNSGHVHDYSSTWPICYDVANKTSDVCRGSDGKPIHSFVNPKGTVHVTEGNGGVPGVIGNSTLTKLSSPAWGRAHGTGGAYGRWTAKDATTLIYEHVQNNGGKVTDTWTITKHAQ